MATDKQLQDIAECEKELRILATKIREVYLNTSTEQGLKKYLKVIKYKTNKLSWDIYNKHEELNRIKNKL